MPFIPVANTVQAEFLGNYFGQEVENVLYFDHQAGDPELADMQLLGELLNNWYVNAFLANINEEFLYKGVQLTSLSTDTSPAIFIPQVPPQVGGVSGDAMPGNVSWAVHKDTATRGRSGSGRWFVVGLSMSQMNGNEIISSVANGIVSDFMSLLDQTSGGDDWQMVLVQKVADGVPVDHGIKHTIVSFSYKDLDLDSQRRRLNGRGK